MKALLNLPAILAGLVLSVSANAALINDNYIGSQDHNFGDVITDPGEHYFNIDQMDVSISGTQLNVSITTEFTNSGAIGSYKKYTTSGNGIGVGDLFLSNQWTPYVSSTSTAANGYLGDNASTGTHWLYGLALQNRWDTATSPGNKGSLTLYALNGTQNSDNIDNSDHFITNGAIYRNGQAVAVKTDSSDVSTVKDDGNRPVTGNWWVDTSNHTINFSIDLGFTGLLADPNLALRWEETCANDAIEGQITHPVPEPATVALLFLGLLGMTLRPRRS